MILRQNEHRIGQTIAYFSRLFYNTDSLYQPSHFLGALNHFGFINNYHINKLQSIPFLYGPVESFCAVFLKYFLIKSPLFGGVDDFGTTHPEIQKSMRRQVVEAWLSVAMRSMAGLAGLTGVPLLQALGATAKAGDLPLPLGFPLKSLGRVFQDFMEGFHCFHLTFWHILMIFRMFSLGTQEKPEISVFFFSGFVSWWSSFLGRKHRRWGTWPNGIFTSKNRPTKKGITLK